MSLCASPSTTLAAATDSMRRSSTSSNSSDSHRSSPEALQEHSQSSLMARMPEHMRARLDARNSRTRATGTPKTPVGDGGKENGGRRSAYQPSPSKCVMEVERMKRQREQRRQRSELQRGSQTCDDHASLIAQYRSSVVVVDGTDAEDEAPPRDEAQQQPLRVYIRKRPLLPPEVIGGQFDVLTCHGGGAAVTLHEARRRVDLEKTLENHDFGFDRVFGEAAGSGRVYEAAVRPLVRSAFEGSRATCFAFGQTGSGKTHTMMGEGAGMAHGVCTPPTWDSNPKAGPPTLTRPLTRSGPV